MADRRCPRCGGWTYVEPGPGRERWLVCGRECYLGELGDFVFTNVDQVAHRGSKKSRAPKP